jgi:hypothetical protein
VPGVRPAYGRSPGRAPPQVVSSGAEADDRVRPKDERERMMQVHWPNISSDGPDPFGQRLVDQRDRRKPQRGHFRRSGSRNSGIAAPRVQTMEIELAAEVAFPNALHASLGPQEQRMRTRHPSEKASPIEVGEDHRKQVLSRSRTARNYPGRTEILEQRQC